MITAVVWFLIGSLFGLAGFVLAAEGRPRLKARRRARCIGAARAATDITGWMRPEPEGDLWQNELERRRRQSPSDRQWS